MTACPNCGFANAEGVKFCAECGTRLLAASEGSRESRRTVTVLFADVTGSTALGEQLDPESLRALMVLRRDADHHRGPGEFYDLRARSRLVFAQLLLDAVRLEEARSRAEEVIDLAQVRGDVIYEARARDLVERTAVGESRSSPTS